MVFVLWVIFLWGENIQKSSCFGKIRYVTVNCVSHTICDCAWVSTGLLSVGVCMAQTRGHLSWLYCWWPVCIHWGSCTLSVLETSRFHSYSLPEISGPSEFIKLGTHSLVLWALDKTWSVVLPLVTVDPYLQSRPHLPLLLPRGTDFSGVRIQ